MTAKPFYITMTDKRLKDVISEIVYIKNMYDWKNKTPKPQCPSFREIPRFEGFLFCIGTS